MKKKLVEESEKLQERIYVAAKQCGLPDEVEHAWVDGLAAEVIDVDEERDSF